MCDQHKAWLKRNGEKKDGKAVNTFRLGGIFLPDSDSRRKLIEVILKMNGTEVEFVADMGTERTVITKDSHRQIGSPWLSHCNEQAKYHDGSTRPLLGKGQAKFSIGDRSCTGHFYVAKGTKNLLGMDMLHSLGLLDTFRKSLEGNVQVEEANTKSDSTADQSEKPKKKHRGNKPKFALGAKVIASLGLQPWRAGYVVNRQGTMYNIRFSDGTIGKFPEKGVKACALDSDEEIFDGLDLREALSDGKTSKGLVGIDCDQRKSENVIA